MTKKVDPMEYRSWISTLSGHLFFHLSEPWNYRLDRIVGDVIHFNEKIGAERYIGISLLADLRDFNKKEKVKYTRIFFFGTTSLENGNDGKTLKGTISFFSNGKNLLHQREEKEIIESLELLRIKLQNLDFDESNKDEENELIHKFKILESNVLEYNQEQESVYTRKIKFCLDSEGIIELGNADNCCSTFTANKTAYIQAYHFIKFMFHNHMHHVKSAEDIIRLSKINNLTDQQFAFFMISDIKKYMVEKRHLRKDFDELEGFSAYAKSLLQVLEKKSFIDMPIVERENKYFDNFTQSVNSHKSKYNVNLRDTKLSFLIDWFLKIFVILMSVLAPYAIIKSKDIVNDMTITIDYFLIHNIFPLYVKGFFLLLLFVPLIDFIYNKKRSFIHLKYYILKNFVAKMIKKRHNPTLNNKPINKMIDFRQYLYHVSFKNKGWYFYLKVFSSITVLALFIKIRFL